MSPEQVLKFLREMFPDRLVLYSTDLAKVLGVSEKALAHLIDRGRLPFAVKLVGSRRCVDIFQVAEWLAAQDALPARQDVEELSSRTAKSKSSHKTVSLKGSAGGSMSKRLVAMRQSASSGIVQNLVGTTNTHDTKFWVDVAEHLALFQFFVQQGFSVKLRWVQEQGRHASQGERVSFFETLDEAFSYAAKSKVELNKFDSASVTIRSIDRKIFHSFKLSQWIDTVGRLA